jgi:DNA-binding transcriptional LysR family regulator
MDLRLLRVFRSVVECGGMAAAELELNIATSTISRHIKDLETRLGLTLCRRGRGGFALTPEGERIHAETLRLLAATDGFRASVDDIHQRMGGELHLAVFDKTASNPEARIAQAVALFRAQAPEVALNLHVGSLNLIERGVMDGQFQLGIIPEHRRSDSLAYDELFGETMLLYCGAAHPLFEAGATDLTWERLRSHDFAGAGLPLAQHGDRPPRAPAPRRHRLRPGVGRHADPERPFPRLPARPLRRSLRARRADARGAAGAVSLRLPLLRHHPPLARAVAGDATAARVPGVGAHKPSGA